MRFPSCLLSDQVFSYSANPFYSKEEVRERRGVGVISIFNEVKEVFVGFSE